MEQRPAERLARRMSVLVAAAGALATLLALGGGARAYQTGPPLDRVGRCNAGPTCWEVDCHDSFRIDSGTAVLDLGLGGATPGPLPASYRYGALYRLRLSVSDPDTSRARFGFELSPVAGCPFSVPAGILGPGDGQRTQVRSDGWLEYLEHACPGIASPTPANCGLLGPLPGSNQWEVDWEAPSGAVGPVEMYYAVNAANGDGLPGGDYIRLGSSRIDPPAGCPAPIAALTLVKGDCDPATPGLPEAQLAWTADPAATGYAALTTVDPRDLGRLTRLAPLAVPCDPLGGPPIVYYQVAGLCADSTNGPL